MLEATEIAPLSPIPAPLLGSRKTFEIRALLTIGRANLCGLRAASSRVEAPKGREMVWTLGACATSVGAIQRSAILYSNSHQTPTPGPSDGIINLTVNCGHVSASCQII